VAVLLVAAGGFLYVLYVNLAFCSGGLCPSRPVVVTTMTWTWNGHIWSHGVRQVGVGSLFDWSNSGNLAYDPDSGQLVLVGSRSNIDDMSTWVWSASGWTSAATSAIGSGTLVYDESNRRLLMFNDTAAYAWTGNAWLKMKSVSGPSNLAVAPEPLIYDGELASVVTMDRNCNRGDTTTMFAFQGGSWVTVPGGTLTSWGDLAFDVARSQLVLFGDDRCGASGSGNCPARTWIFDGSKWTRQGLGATPLVNKSQPGCYQYNMRMNRIVYDPDLNQVLLLGASQLWAWDGRGWSAASASLPAGMDSASSLVAFDGQLHKLFVVSTVID
jgi:hypothetical protein